MVVHQEYILIVMVVKIDMYISIQLFYSVLMATPPQYLTRSNGMFADDG